MSFFPFISRSVSVRFWFIFVLFCFFSLYFSHRDCVCVVWVYVCVLRGRKRGKVRRRETLDSGASLMQAPPYLCMVPFLHGIFLFTIFTLPFLSCSCGFQLLIHFVCFKKYNISIMNIFCFMFYVILFDLFSHQNNLLIKKQKRGKLQNKCQLDFFF